MELRHLRYFVAVAEEMNIHRAAERLHISQPPLSLTIKQLEEEIGVELFTREGRGIQITRAGEQFLKRARQILTDAEKASIEAKQSSLGITGTLRIGFIGSSVTGILQDCVSVFKKKYPSVSLELQLSTTTGLPSEVADGKYDVAIMRVPQSVPEGVTSKIARRESWMVAIPEKHRLCLKTTVTFKDLENERLIFYPRSNSSDSYDDVMQMFKDHKVVPNIYQETNEQITIGGLVASGMGIGIVPECMSLIKIPGVIHRHLKGTKNRTGFAIIYKNEKDVLVRNFLREAGI